MSSKIIKYMSNNNQVRLYVIDGKSMITHAQKHQVYIPLDIISLGQTLMVTSMMGAMLKRIKDKLSIQFSGDKYIKQMVVVGGANGNVKGFIDTRHDTALTNISCDLKGTMLRITSDMGMREPYTSMMTLNSGGIAEALTDYFVTSEQIPTSVGLSVDLNKDGNLVSAKGYIIQLLPNANETTIQQLEKNINRLPQLNTIKNLDDLRDCLLFKLGFQAIETLQPDFICDCSRDYVEGMLISLGTKEIRAMVKDEDTIEVECEFCHKKYKFDQYQLQTLLDQLMFQKYSLQEGV